jgi:hypothetical protein
MLNKVANESADLATDKEADDVSAGGATGEEAYDVSAGWATGEDADDVSAGRATGEVADDVSADRATGEEADEVFAGVATSNEADVYNYIFKFCICTFEMIWIVSYIGYKLKYIVKVTRVLFYFGNSWILVGNESNALSGLIHYVYAFWCFIVGHLLITNLYII